MQQGTGRGWQAPSQQLTSLPPDLNAQAHSEPEARSQAELERLRAQEGSDNVLSAQPDRLYSLGHLISTNPDCDCAGVCRVRGAGPGGAGAAGGCKLALTT